jgi:hypothetical protein
MSTQAITANRPSLPEPVESWIDREPPLPPPPPPIEDGVDAIDRSFASTDATPGYGVEQARADAKALHEATDGWGTDEDKISRTLHGKSKEDLDLIRQEFKATYKKDLDQVLRDETSGDERRLVDNLLQGTRREDPAQGSPHSISDQIESDRWGFQPSAARPAPPVASESQEFGGVTSYIHDEIMRNKGSATVKEIQAANAVAGGSLAMPPIAVAAKGTAYGLWAEKVGPDREWDHKDSIANAYGGWSPVPGQPGEISWDVWSNIHYGFVGKEAGFSDWELHKGADAADKFKENPGDQLAVQIGIDLYNKYGDDLKPEHIQQAIIEHYDEFGAKGKIYGDSRYTPEGWKSPHSRK